MLTRVNPEAAFVRQCTEHALGEPVRTLTELAGSVTNASFRVATETRTVLFKRCRPADWRNEVTALTVLAEQPGVPTAQLLAHGEDAGRSWLVLDWVDGAPATTDDLRARAGVTVRALHALPAPHFGRPSAPRSSWHEHLLAGLDDDLAVVREAGLLDARATTAIARAVHDLPPYRGEPHWLHGDLKDLHLHARDGDLVALLDFGDACGGDPLHDLARYSLEGADKLKALLTGYGEVDLDAEAMRAHRLRFTLDCLATEARADGDWFEVYQQRIAADL